MYFKCDLISCHVGWNVLYPLVYQYVFWICSSLNTFKHIVSLKQSEPAIRFPFLFHVKTFILHPVIIFSFTIHFITLKYKTKTASCNFLH